MRTKSSPSPDATPISRLVEAQLHDHRGSLLGIVDELLIDLRSGRIEYVLAIGLRGQRLRFPWSSIAIQDQGFVLRRSGPRLVIDRADADPGREHDDG